MKKYFYVGALLLLSSVLPSYANHYTPQNSDFSILDRLEQKVSDAVDAGKIDPEKFVNAIEGLLNKKKYSDRVETLLGQLIEDINYSYNLGKVDDFSMTADDCYDDEKFDAQTQVCVPVNNGSGNYNNKDWGNDYINKDYQEKKSWGNYDNSQDSYDSQYDGQDTTQYDNQYDSSYGSQDGLKSSDPEQQVPNDANYTVQNDTISLVSGKKDPTDEKIWNMFVTLIPATYRVDLKNYFVYTDKNDGNIAGVNQNEQNSNVWDLTVNKALFYDANGNFDVKENIHTLVHEFAHLLTLGKEQVDYIPSNIQSDAAIDRLAAKCTTTFLTEGCLKSNAYLEKFIEKFWTKKDIQTTEEQQGDVYSGNESKFVSDYAATDTAEDISESFTYFVIQGMPTGNTVADQKIKFFYQYDELVALREMIRKRVADITAGQ